MDKIWDRKSFKVGGHWPLWRGWKKPMTTQIDKSPTTKKINNNLKKLLAMIFAKLHASILASNVSCKYSVLFRKTGIFPHNQSVISMQQLVRAKAFV